MSDRPKLGKLLFQEDDAIHGSDKETVWRKYMKLFGADYHKESTKVLANYGDNEYIETPHAIIWSSACGDSAIYELPSNDPPSEDWEVDTEAPVDAPKVDAGGYAFPHSYANGEYVTDGGMSLLDYFAGQALLGLLSSPGDLPSKQMYAETAYEFAKQMIETRRKVLDGR